MSVGVRLNGKDNFNCTIQELKHLTARLIRMYIEDFNCTIQELKPASL